MIRGSCLCGGVQFGITEPDGPFEICHCNRCRKVSGSSSMATLAVRTKDFSLLAGRDLIASYAAPILYQAPAYETYFCKVCGSPVPAAENDGEYIEVPAGLFDDDPVRKPDKHIFVELLPNWDSISDELPQYTIRDLVRARHNQDLPDNFELKTHYGHED